MSEKSSYGQILKASSIMGGAAGINLLLGMMRVKFAAHLIGAAGVGLNASFGALQGLIGTLAGLGIQSSGVREIAVALGKGNQEAVGRTVLTLRRICWLTGLVGMLGTMLLSPWLSQITFGHQQYTLDIASLGVVILLSNLSGGQLALIQGMRRIGDMARANIVGAALGTVAAIGFYSALGMRGIIPTLICVSLMQLTVSWYFVRQVPVHQVKLSWRQTLTEANSMVKLGLVMMANGLMGSAVNYITISLITQYEGLQAVGLYSAAFALSGIFVNFVLGAMGADYYPRLTAVATDRSAMNRMINQQTEVGLLLALPGLMATIALTPWIVQIFYTKEFLDSVELIQWFIFGCLGRVISWPLGYVMLALSRGRWFLLTETSFNALHALLIAVGLHFLGIEGVAVAFFVMYIGYSIALYLVCRHLTGFAFSSECKRLILLALPILGLTLLACRSLSLWPASIIGLGLTFIASILCLRELTKRIGMEQRVVRTIAKIPGIRFFLSI